MPDEASVEQAVYSAASQQWVHAEQMRWTILYNFLVGNTILLVAWSQLFAALLAPSNVHAVGLNIVLIGFCGIGIGGSIVWIFLGLRANRFSQQYFEAGLRLEEQLLSPDETQLPRSRARLSRRTGWLWPFRSCLPESTWPF
jgi:hypothetical protein